MDNNIFLYQLNIASNLWVVNFSGQESPQILNQIK